MAMRCCGSRRRSSSTSAASASSKLLKIRTTFSMPCILPLDDGAQRADVDIPVGHRPVVALQHEGVQRSLRDLHGGAGGTVNFHGPLDAQPIEDEAEEAGVLHLLAGAVEARRLEP